MDLNHIIKKSIWIAFVEFEKLYNIVRNNFKRYPKGNSIFMFGILFIRKAVARKGIENQPRKI